MVPVEHIHIGSLLRTNKGEIIKVESISTKRKVGYHPADNPSRIKYVRLCECELVETPITPELLAANGWIVRFFLNHKDIPDYARVFIGADYAEYDFGKHRLNIWRDFDTNLVNDVYPDIHLRVCKTAEKLSLAFALADIDYKLKAEQNETSII